MSKSRTRPKRVWHPRPSPAARARILGAVRALLADPLTAGFGVAPRHVARLLAAEFTYHTARTYMQALAAAGDLSRAAISPCATAYTLPA